METPLVVETEISASPTFTSQPTTSTPTPLPIPRNTPAVSQADLQGVIVRFWHPWTGEAGQVIQSLIQEFNRTNTWGIDVVSEQVGGFDAIGHRMNDVLGSEQAPHLVVGYLHQAYTWNQRQALLDLSAYVDDPIWGMTAEEQEDFYPIFWNHDVDGDRRFGIPAQRSGQILLYNRSWAKELGYLSAPTTPEQFRAQACAAARANFQDGLRENDGTGGWIINSDYPTILAWIYAFDGHILKSPQANSEASPFSFNNPEVEEAFTFLRTTFEQGCAWLSETPSIEGHFAERRGLFAASSVMNIPYQKEAFDEASNNDDWTVIPYPSPSVNPAIIVYGPSYFVFESSLREQLAGWLLIKWLISPANHARLVQANSSFPLRTSEMTYLVAQQIDSPQWAAAVNLLSIGIPEPAVPSWGMARWALDDAGTQLFRYYFTLEQLPQLLNFLDHTVAEIQQGPEQSGIFYTPTNTSLPSATPTRTLTPTATLRASPTITPASSAPASPTARAPTSISPTATATR